MAISIRNAAVGDTLVLENGYQATVTRESGSPLWSPGCADSVRARYHHPTDDGWNGHEGDWDADGAKQSAGAWPAGADVVMIIPGIKKG
jgi:hypothetical protein